MSVMVLIRVAKAARLLSARLFHTRNDEQSGLLDHDFQQLCNYQQDLHDENPASSLLCSPFSCGPCTVIVDRLGTTGRPAWVKSTEHEVYQCSARHPTYRLGP